MMALTASGGADAVRDYFIADDLTFAGVAFDKASLFPRRGPAEARALGRMAGGSHRRAEAPAACRRVLDARRRCAASVTYADDTARRRHVERELTIRPLMWASLGQRDMPRRAAGRRQADNGLAGSATHAFEGRFSDKPWSAFASRRLLDAQPCRRCRRLKAATSF